MGRCSKSIALFGLEMQARCHGTTNLHAAAVRVGERLLCFTSECVRKQAPDGTARPGKPLPEAPQQEAATSPLLMNSKILVANT